ncbi:related to transposase [Sporisorium reilianum SRZ2]|uniref:Related to transposase n=1 Tax=Sporisorium reilianum (strain SRZ2) TaxID=999809 RepID=E6ZVH9_SPORE|nr:related to transposase [Sporisorium reilianum SRZ2]
MPRRTSSKSSSASRTTRGETRAEQQARMRQTVAAYLRSQVPVPRTAAAFNATLDAYREEAEPRQAQAFRRAILSANEQDQATITILQTENAMLHRKLQQLQSEKATHEFNMKMKRLNPLLVTTENFIPRWYAEKYLVRGGPSTSSDGRQDEQQQQAAAAAAVPDRDQGVPASSTSTTAPATLPAADVLDDGEPLSAISDDDGASGVFETLPQAGPSCSKH